MVEKKKSEIWVRVRLLGDTIRSAALGLDDKETSRQRWHLTRRAASLGKVFFFFPSPPPFFLTSNVLSLSKQVCVGGVACVGGGGAKG